MRSSDDVIAVVGRHGIALFGSRNIVLDGLTVTETGGDGVYVSNILGHVGTPNVNVTITNCNLHHNYRNAISGAPCSVGLEFWVLGYRVSVVGVLVCWCWCAGVGSLLVWFAHQIRWFTFEWFTLHRPRPIPHVLMT